jgi:uncharacterized membrane protein
MTTKATENAAIDDRSATTDLLVESVESLLLVPEQVIKNVEAITTHQERYQQTATIDRRVLEKIVSIFGQPQFLYFQIVFFLGWGAFTHLVDLQVLPPIDFPRLDLREQGLDIASLLISTGVLVYESRQEQLNDERSHLMLQLNLITEQKIAKLISLIEELRTDLPNVRNRDDLEAEIMKQATDPQVILEVIQQNLEQSPSPPPEDKPDET